VTDAFQVDSAHLHAPGDAQTARLVQLTAITGASRAISQDDSAYGVLCGWISAILERRHIGQDELYAYVKENLLLLAEALESTGRDYDAADGNAQRSIRAAGGLG